MNAPVVIQVEQQSTHLMAYENACTAVAEAKNVFEAKDIRDKSEAMRVYQRQAKNKQLETDAAEIRIRAERKIGQLMQQQREAGLMNTGTAGEGRPSLGGVRDTPPKQETPTLAEAGIDKNLAKRARESAAIPEEEFEEIVDDWRGRIAEENEKVTVNIVAAAEKYQKNTHVTNNSGNNEWYTPPEFIETAREVLGEITLDPASSEIANLRVQAKNIFTIDVDGINQDWSGNIWMNPPYSQPEISHFCAKVSEEFNSGRIDSAIVLTNNATETAWFGSMASCASAIFLPKGRIRYYSPEGVQADSPLQGQCFTLLTNSDDVLERFKTLFPENHSGVCFVGASN